MNRMSQEEPTFKYLQDTKTNSAIKGLFVFTLYIKKKKLDNNQGSIIFERSVLDTPYAKGIQMYVNSIKKNDSVFKNWKVLIYTDKPTLDLLIEENVFVKDSTVDICIVEWEYYKNKETDHINGDIMRCMRFRAFFDFQVIPVFVRDADTLFITDLAKNSCYIKYFKDECLDIVYEWEKNFLEGALQYPNTWIMGTSMGYKRDWHKNTKKGYYAPLGAFAGFQSLIPTVSCFTKESLWSQAMNYIVESSTQIVTEEKVVKNSGMEYHINSQIKYSNNVDPVQKIGKDERILIFIFFPNCDINNIFFFELNYGNRRNAVLKGTSKTNLTFPSIVFKRGSNQNIKNIFVQSATIKNAPFSQNLEQKRKEVIFKNRQIIKAKENSIKNSLRTLKNKNYEFDETLVIPHILNDIFYSIDHLDKDNKLFQYLSQYQKEKERSDQLKKYYIKKMAYNNDITANNRKAELAKLELASYAKDKAMNEFLEKTLSMITKEELLDSFSDLKKTKIKALLESYIENSKKGGKRKTRRKNKNR